MRFATGAFTEIELRVTERETDLSRYWIFKRSELARLSNHDQQYIADIMFSRFGAEPVYPNAKIQARYRAAK